MHRMYRATCNPVPNELTWPELCPSCGDEMRDPGTTQLSFSVEGVAQAKLPLCSVCSTKWKRRDIIEKVAYSAAGLVFLLAVFVPPVRQDHLYGAGAAFWLGILIGWVSKRAREALSFRQAKSEKQGLILWFRSESYRDEFVSKNTVAKAQGSALFV